MNVLSLIDSFNPELIGGAARVFYEVNTSLLEKGHSVQAIYREGEEGQRAKETKEGVTVHTYPDIEGSQLKKFKYYGRSIKKLFNEYIANNKTDLIIIHSSSAVLGLYYELKKIDIPIIYYFHSPWNREYEIIADKKCCGIQCPVVTILSHIRKRHEKKYINLASGIVTLSESMQDILLEVHTSVKEKKLLIDPGAADGDKFFPVKDKEEKKSIRNELGLNSDDFIIITSRRLVPRTGVDLLVKAFVEARKKHRKESMEPFDGTQDRQGEEEKGEHPTSNPHAYSHGLPFEHRTLNASKSLNHTITKSQNLKLILTGGGGEADSLKQLAVDLGVGEEVIFTGHVSEEDLAKYYRCSDLFVMPTKFLEGFGLSTVEAMASGLPVIGTDIGGTPEILKKISDELLISECSIQAISNKINEFVIKEDLETWRDKSLNCFKENFTWAKHTDKLLDFVSSNLITP